MPFQFENVAVFGDNPLPRFGHSVTVYAANCVCLFGGATGTAGQFSITDNAYTFDVVKKLWTKLITTGTTPSARAAHAAVCIETNKIVIYGGATGTGGLASDDLFHLDINEGVSIWNTIVIEDNRTPGRRYGHTLSYMQPYLIVFGGNIGERPANDCWILNNQKSPLVWNEVVCEGDVPCPRVYHSAAVCTVGAAASMIVIFGGRQSNNTSLNDTWGLRRHRKGHWDWLKAPEKTRPKARYQHSSLFYGPLMLIIGGRTENVNEFLPVEVFDTQRSQWTSYNSLQRFRHASWLCNNNVWVYGGFELEVPSVPIDTVSCIHLNNLPGVSTNNNVRSALQDMQGSDMMGNSPIPGIPNPRNPPGVSTPLLGRRDQQSQPVSATQGQRASTVSTTQAVQPQREPPLQKKKKVILKEPIVATSGKYQPPYDIKKPLMVRQDIPYFFLNTLCQPNEFANNSNIQISFRAEHVLTLCNLAEEIIMNEPMILSPKTPLKIFGDIHGQFSDFMNFFRLYGSPHENERKNDIENYDYVFLGDFVDRGAHSLETICLLLALKCVYPGEVHLIRGNHQDGQININFGFKDECSEKLDEDSQEPGSVFNRINKLFEWLPLAALIEDKILCLHGGIGQSLETLQDIHSIKRPLEVLHDVQGDKEAQMVLDILWSDPTESDNEKGIHPNHLRDPSEAGNIVKFGPDRVESFLERNGLSLIVRAHECVMDGFERFAGGKLITVFSATDYCRKHKNAGAILIVKTNYQIQPKLIYPSNNNANNWIENEEQLNRRPPTPPRWRNQRNY